MTKPLRALLEIIATSVESPSKVVEIGSRQAKNQEEIADLRELFPNSMYLGVDMEDGPGVDLVQLGESLPFKDASVEFLICLETFEHCEKFWEVASEIERVVERRGIVVVSSQQNFPIHLHPSDYFRFTPMGMSSLFPGFKSSFVVTISPPFDDEVKLNPQHVIFVGSKAKNDPRIAKIKKDIANKKSALSVHKPYRHRLQDSIKFVKRGINELFFRQEIEFF